ncbi:MAG: hypothetical protein AAF483_12715 [Planctomycetota bacterium]
MSDHPITTDECFWIWTGDPSSGDPDAKGWVQQGDCEDDGCTCTGKPTSNGNYVGETVPGVCDCGSTSGSTVHSGWSGKYRKLNASGARPELVSSEAGKAIPVEEVSTTLSFCRQISYIAEAASSP